MWYVLRFFGNDFTTFHGMIVSEGANEDEALENARACGEVPDGEVYGLELDGAPPAQLRYRLFGPLDKEVIAINARTRPVHHVEAHKWYWIRFEDEAGNHTGVILSDGETVVEALKCASQYCELPPGEPMAYPYPLEPPDHLRYRVLSAEEQERLSGDYVPTSVGGWVAAVMQKTQEHDISKLPNARTLQGMMAFVNRFRK